MAYDNEGNYVDERGMGPNPEFMVMPTAMPLSRVEEPPPPNEPPQLINSDFAVMPGPRRSDTAEDYAAWRALYPDAYSDFWGDKPPSSPPPQLDPNYNPYETQPQPYNPYVNQLQPYPYEAVRDLQVSYPYDPSTNTYPTAPPGYNPYDTQPKPYQPYETLPQPDNPYVNQLQPYPYEAQPLPYKKPYNPEQNDKPTVYPYGTQPTAPSSAMDIGQILAGIGYGNPTQPNGSDYRSTMAPMVSSMAGAVPGMNGMPSQLSGMGAALKPGTSNAPGTGSDLASLLRRYYGK